MRRSVCAAAGSGREYGEAGHLVARPACYGELSRSRVGDSLATFRFGGKYQWGTGGTMVLGEPLRVRMQPGGRSFE